MQWIRSLFFIAQMYLMMALMALFFLPIVFLRDDGAYIAHRVYCRYVRWSAAWMVGLRSEIRGEIPQGEVIIAAKHQSFFDILLIVSVIPRPRFVMKKELRYAPIFGWYVGRIGCIPVDRGKGAKAVQDMVAAVLDPDAPKGQLVIYPQGTRVGAGAYKTYKVGVGALYSELDQQVIPAATNVGVFWPRHGILRKPGLAVVEFLPPIAPGQPLDAFMAEVEDTVEAASNRLMVEAGFPEDQLPEGRNSKTSA
ncbi:lysophospholipid acyltransferase family protein [Tropicimonas sp. S265A]|uniref:lysophospholipid acyltransferase family protein n=1 Tax=Tropicimonas sp. S265A TaxID=3415134 RepID=UPI003C7CC64C